MENGASAEIAVVGNEGIVGVSLFMGGGSTPSRGVVQSAGKGYRLAAQLMQVEFNKAGPVLHLLLRYTQAPYYTDVTNRGVQPPSFVGPIVVSLVAAESRPAAG